MPEYLAYLKPFFRLHAYPRKLLLTDSLVSCLASTERLALLDRRKLLNTSSCIESIIFGSYLFEYVERIGSLMDLVPFSRLIKKKFSEKNIILSADFFYAIATQKSIELGSDLEISLLSRVNEINFRVSTVYAGALRKNPALSR